MSELILRLEQRGQTLGEWTLSGGPLSMSLRDPSTGETVAVFRASLPGGPAPGEPFDAPTEASRVDEAPATQPGLSHYDEIGVVGLSADGEPERIPGDDFTMPNPEPTDPSRASKNLSLIGAAYLGEKTATVAEGYTHDETTYIRERGAGGSAVRQLAGGRAEPGQAAARSAAAFPPIGSAGSEPLLEVWFYKNQQWVRRGWLSSGQRASLRGGVIRCTRGGALLVSPGAWFTISAVLPSGKQLQVEPGSKPVRLPSGSAVTLWDGERGLHVRDVETADDDTQEQRLDRGAGSHQIGRAALRP